MNWLYLAAISAFFYGLYNVLIKLSSGSIHQMVGAVALQIVAALLGIAALIILKLLGHPLTASKQGFLLSACAGLAVGVAEILTFYLFEIFLPSQHLCPQVWLQLVQRQKLFAHYPTLCPV